MGIARRATGLATAAAVALTALALTASGADGYVYWANSGGGKSIGRANPDGTGANRTFITGVGAPQGLAADRKHIYWANLATDSIGRASIDGTDVRPDYVTGASLPKGVAVAGKYIYWANLGSELDRAGQPGRDRRAHPLHRRGRLSPGCRRDAHSSVLVGDEVRHRPGVAGRIEHRARLRDRRRMHLT